MIKKYINDDAKLAIYLEKKLDLPSSSLSSKKKLGLIEEWDSLAHLSLIMLIEKEMKIEINVDKLVKCKTSDQLLSFIKNLSK